LSEEGIKQLLQNRKSVHRITRDMHKIDEALYFVIEEKTIR
jgi:preprotein translocase subunit SecA